MPQCLPPNRKVWTAPLINSELVALLHDARTIKTISLTIAPQLLDAVQAGRHLSGRDALREMSSGYGAHRIGLNMQNRNGLDKDEVIGLVNWAFEQGAGLLSAAKAVVQLKDGTTQPINLLRNRIGAEREMELMSPSERSIAHASAQTEIVTAFYSLEEQLKVATSLWSVGPDDDLK